MDVTKDVIRMGMHLFELSIKKDRIPRKNCIVDQLKKHIDHDLKRWKDDELLCRIVERVQVKLNEDITVFVFALTQLQDVYTHYLQSNFFRELEKINTFDDDVNLNWFKD